MLRKVIALAALGLALSAGQALASGTTNRAPKHVEFGFEGPFGTFDQAQLQRGYKVYREVCSSCHGMTLMSFRNLGQKHGPFYDADRPNPNDNPYVRAIAAEYQINDVDSETGDVIQRPGSSADRFPNPYPNEAAARAGNGGALPPDLSVLIKARHHGPQYVYSILTGYANPPAGLKVSPGQYYNPYVPGDLAAFWTGDSHHVPPGGFIAMPPPLRPDGVTFDDGTRATVEQQAKDVVAFLTWAAEPKMIERKQFGMAAMIYLLILAGLVYASYRRIWRNVAH
ncbi:cytochrome c1 [Phenylobacterium sp.]|jgi:ubiquinol-cytochrome c reductase cytochrome c1 subunit|uniref:cytochrome c1 n=1 Tax=Phenylobacterium sp. TaxID=1871053 RepID=UPI002E364C45|nr:cytochrome c1 [Phenylobacterium sp.]HEX2561931.1 cytochrome c1 [Phenylobacterium sp.]